MKPVPVSDLDTPVLVGRVKLEALGLVRLPAVCELPGNCDAPSVNEAGPTWILVLFRI